MKIQLPNVTLVCIDTFSPSRGHAAIENCLQYADFGKAFLLGRKLKSEEKDYYKHQSVYHFPINTITSKEAYSYFVFKELRKYIITDYVMICQYDGFIINPEAWTDEFLQYDYIGAPWWYDDNHNVGNGGFSLRSKRLMNFLANNLKPIFGTHPEDERICRNYRDEIEGAGFTYAPEPLAERFSWEGNGKHTTYKGSFGFHGNKYSLPINIQNNILKITEL